jgi:hypothetical protein
VMGDDESNCGDCGVTCAAGETCCSGVCIENQCGTCPTACTEGNEMLL